MLEELRSHLQALASPQRAANLRWFFKTGPGEYGEGDQFLGLTNPQLRALARTFAALPLAEVSALLHSPWHEERALALMILVRQYEKGTPSTREECYTFYLRHTHRINNWDLVDISAPHIVGAHLRDKDRSVLYELAASSSLWEQRIAVLATFAFVRDGQFLDTFQLATSLLHHPHDLIHKAVGWMLREVGKRDRAAEEAFLRPHYHQMPRTMLRYAIERFPEPLRQAYLKGRV
jgi:3-methyladenine DNA glycosylase AlkD